VSVTACRPGASRRAE